MIAVLTQRIVIPTVNAQAHHPKGVATSRLILVSSVIWAQGEEQMIAVSRNRSVLNTASVHNQRRHRSAVISSSIQGSSAIRQGKIRSALQPTGLTVVIIVVAHHVLLFYHRWIKQ